MTRSPSGPWNGFSAAARIHAPAGRGRAGRDAKPQPEQRPQLALPVADEPGRRHDEHAADSAAGQHLADVEAGHDRLAGSGVVRQQEPQGLLRDHPLVDRDALVGQGVDARDLGGEGRIELVAVGQAHGRRPPLIWRPGCPRSRAALPRGEAGWPPKSMRPTRRRARLPARGGGSWPDVADATGPIPSGGR